MATAPPAPPPQGQMRPPMPPGAVPPGARPPPMQVAANPALQALLDAQPVTPRPFTTVTAPIPNTQPPQTNTLVVCPRHQRQVCAECDVDFTQLNYMHQFLRAAPPEAIPPPPNHQPPPQRAEAIKALKEQGNAAFKAQNYVGAIQAYSRSADMALSRPPWELASVSREETSIALCNRSAAFAFAGHWPNALADAEAVVALRRPYTKGHFRKARALVGLNRFEDARQAIIDGLQFEPEDKELNAFLKDVDEKLASLE